MNDIPSPSNSRVYEKVPQYDPPYSYRFSNSPQTDLSLEVVIRSFQQVLFSEEKDQKPGDYTGVRTHSRNLNQKRNNEQGITKCFNILPFSVAGVCAFVLEYSSMRKFSFSRHFAFSLPSSISFPDSLMVSH